MTNIKIGDWVKHPEYGIGRLLGKGPFRYFIFPEVPNTGDNVNLIDVTKVIPKFDNFSDLFEEDKS